MNTKLLLRVKRHYSTNILNTLLVLDIHVHPIYFLMWQMVCCSTNQTWFLFAKNPCRNNMILLSLCLFVNPSTPYCLFFSFHKSIRYFVSPSPSLLFNCLFICNDHKVDILGEGLIKRVSYKLYHCMFLLSVQCLNY